MITQKAIPRATLPFAPAGTLTGSTWDALASNLIPAYLCTDIGRDKATIEWAFERSIQNRRPTKD